jgi:amino acid transporter
MVGNAPFGVVVGLFGSIILIMAVNTAYVASSELLERVAHRYRFAWFTVINRRGSLYRIHVCNGLLYTSIILLTAGSQHVLAEMYAIGLLASFCINLGCLLVYRYVHGSSELRVFHTSRVGTLLFECILVACLVYLMVHKPYGTALWASVVTVLLAAGLPLSRRYGPEVKEVQQSDFTMKMILALAESDGPLHMYFRRPGEVEATQSSPDTVFITFFSPRAPIPPKAATNHFRFPIQGGSVYGSICAILALIQEEFEGRDVHIHLGWPLSSWLDRLATGVFVVQLMRLPQRFPDLCFSIEYETHHVLTQQAESDVTIGIHPIEVSSGNRGLPSSNGALHSRALDPIRR